eukprot:gnl/TRDRNA2_/TRDRNA2_35723_c1_seq1.p1 gnl/TRDRNA2_/TRDRNA2_35723_c1~~gnl/TRDRNA2_/TRDRNA2_35723_c1_seq1.p1  ORF type:complete len:585 (+),score=90.56 gnl/TRDRNA2_/TRDRNA2_35723_c1_seq1:47-1756(+)
MSFSDCSIDIEQQNSSDPSKMTLLNDFRDLCGEGGTAEGLLQCLQMYGYHKPNKLQQHAIPAILHFLGKQLGGAHGPGAGRGKSCMVVQGPSRTGKTSSVILALLAAIDLSVNQPQAILLSGTSRREFDKYLSVFTLMQPVTFQSLGEEEDGKPLDDNSPSVKTARTAHILIGQPRHMLRVLSSASSLFLDSVKVLVIDDAEELLYTPPEPLKSPRLSRPGSRATSRTDVSSGRRPGSSTEPSSPMADTGGTPRRTSEAQSTAASSVAPSSPSRSSARLSPDSKAAEGSGDPVHSSMVESIVQICNVLECRQYSNNNSETYRIRMGQEQGAKIRYVILTQPVPDPASRKVLRLLKSSLMKKKNLLGVESCPPPTKLIKAIKHYYVEAPRSEWVKVFAGLVQSLMFPRALIFCDDEQHPGIRGFFNQMKDMKIAASANLPDVPGPNGEPLGPSEARRRAVQEFTGNKSQFLLTRSEPAVCQIVLPKVSCVFHFGLPDSMRSMYGVRLLPLDADLAKDAASILFVDAPRGGTGATPTSVSAIGKLFDIRFMDMPFEFLPETGKSQTRKARH